MFTQKLLSLDIDRLAQSVAEDGVCVIEDALAPDAIAAIERDVAENRTGININGVTGAYYFHQFYLCHMLAVSRTFAQLVTDPKIIEIIERIVGPEYRLKALRYYETFGPHHMQWHTDNKTDRGFAQIPGVIFIVYISDVEDGEFQYVRGSHKWSGEKAYNDYSDAFVEGNFGENILSFKGRAGTLIVYDTYGIHRAKPASQDDFVRKSLFWQIDRETSQAEPILLNPEFLDKTDAKTLRYLGFGLPTEYHRFPQTDVRSIALERMRPDDFTYLKEQMSRDVELALSRSQNALFKSESELAAVRFYVKNMPVRDVAKVLARAVYRHLPSGLQRGLKRAMGRHSM